MNYWISGVVGFVGIVLAWAAVTWAAFRLVALNDPGDGR